REIEQWFAIHDPDADRRDVVVQGNGPGDVAFTELFEGESQGHEGPGNGRRARAAVCLNDVAVDPDSALTERRQVRDRAERSADEPLDFLRPPADLAAAGLAGRSGVRRARQH